ncbi:aldehyde dehydrogenase (NADP(+)) [Novosphingobium bradum]|uniref:Aldehyde dehydrogenase (NADP(+)) n=1 Tax=Novosphingobium bradum TaxID=1737444 RepID=A0ABV7IMT6_9SPHN
MTGLSGELFIGADRISGSGQAIHGWNPATGERLDPAYPGASLADVERACGLADEAFDPFRALPLGARADFLERIAANILGIGDALIERAMAETGLPRGRLEGERGRTVTQLRLFAEVVRAGRFLEARVDPAQPDRQPAPRPDLRLRMIGLGPVAVFGASNFPLAFSVAGGDTASALAAGCPVVVKAHSAHPGTSELVGKAVQQAVAECGLPAGVFSLLFGNGTDIGRALVADPRIKAVGFTGSRSGGLALLEVAQGRPEPIPVYAEMSSINPVLLLPGALAERAPEIARAFVASVTLGAGQFCTNPGLLVAVEGEGLDAFVEGAALAMASAEPQVMLTAGIARAYGEGVDRLGAAGEVTLAGRGRAASGNQGQAALFSVSAKAFLANPALQEEVFGAAALLVRCGEAAELHSVLRALQGQLTAALHVADGDAGLVQGLLPLLERKVGRIIFNNFGTGVEVAHAMVHGGPFPATSDSRTTSVGTLAIDRFLRPVSYQDMPEALLPDELKSANPLAIPRLVDGA